MKATNYISSLPTSSLTIAPAKLTPEKAKQVLEQHGLQVTKEQASNILAFLFTLARATTR